MTTEHVFVTWICKSIKGEASRWFSPLLTVPRRFLCCNSSLFMCLWFHMWCLYYSYLFLVFPCFDVSGGLCFVIVAFLGYPRLFLLRPSHFTNSCFSTDRSKAVPLLQLFVRASEVPYVTFVLDSLFLISPFDASGWLCFVIVAYPGYLH